MRYGLTLLACVFAVHAFAGPTTAPYECHRATSPITLDGKADDPAWKDATVIENFQQFWKPEGNRVPQHSTKAMLLWDDDYLYFHADMTDADLYAFGSKRQDTLWKGDVFELFFKPSDDAPPYYEFEVGPTNLTIELAFPKRGADFVKVVNETKIKMESAVQVRGTVNHPGDTDEGWSVEGRIPWKDLAATGGAPKPGADWRFALCRCNHANPPSKDEELSSSAPLTKANFHRLEDYGVIRFVPAQHK